MNLYVLGVLVDISRLLFTWITLVVGVVEIGRTTGQCWCESARRQRRHCGRGIEVIRRFSRLARISWKRQSRGQEGDKAVGRWKEGKWW